MKRNERIAEKMGWEYFSAGGFPLNEIGNNWESVKALQARMVDDGWAILIWHTESGFYCEARNKDEIGRVIFETKDQIATEPAALVELFCKVYGIEEEA
jgi:hypothetical protein